MIFFYLGEELHVKYSTAIVNKSDPSIKLSLLTPKPLTAVFILFYYIDPNAVSLSFDGFIC